MQGQPNYARQAGHYEGMLKGIAFTLSSIAKSPHLTQKQIAEKLESMSSDIENRIATVNKECVY